MAGIREFSEQLFNGEVDTVFDAHPLFRNWNDRVPDEIDEGILYYKGISGATTLDTGKSLVMLDTGARNDAGSIFEGVRNWRPDHPLAAAVFSHHHVDHIFGVEPFEAEASTGGNPRTVVYGHEAMPWHFDRYRRARGWNSAINRRQFARPGMPLQPLGEWPDDFRYPDVTFRDRVTFSEGDLTFELTHDRGETEDSTWTWVPELNLLAPGDLFIYAVPNAGNPQKVQRWVGEWAVGLRKMAALDAELLIPGHGFPIFGADRIHTALDDTATLLETIEGQTLALMNQGATLDRVLHEVEIPADLLEKPYLRPVYDHPEFLIRNVWRLYGGWWEGEPDNLLPAPRAAQATEWVALAGGIDAVLARAEELRASGSLQLACHIIEYAVLAEPDSADAHDLRAQIYEERAEEQLSSMSRGIYTFASDSSKAGMRDGFEPPSAAT
ncbi:MAG TPA: alkyl sulfatase dimerization domain-containing protein [Dehalococcoidia bacterium]|jgi:glyoxylase-like metal-dependent hydrolase (beta-lactamase superfamily II)|nr:alkyl sulfatase dimerization domain-containing protein [Dehalococcoidia bacterium]